MFRNSNPTERALPVACPVDDSPSNREGLSEAPASNDLLNAPETECSICKCVMFSPLSFDECGHTFCELCMIQIDSVAKDTAATNEFPMYRCPTCRAATLQPWNRRPRNHALEAILTAIPGYQEKCESSRQALEEYCDANEDTINSLYPTTTDTAQGVNLAQLSRSAQEAKVRSLLARIIPIVYEAAASGMPSIVINTKAKDLYVFVKAIGKELFKLGIHSVASTPREFVVYVTTPMDNDYSNTYANPNYNDQSSENESTV